MKSRIALITYHAPPMLSAESILVGKVVKQLANEISIDLICAGDDPDFGKDLGLAKLLDHPHITVFPYPTSRPQNKIVRRLMDKASAKVGRQVHESWLKGVLRHHDWSRGYEILFSRSQPPVSHLLALAVKEKLQIPWVASFSDPWAYNPYHPGTASDQLMEQDVVSQADRLLFPTSEILALMQQHYPDLHLETKSAIIPHCFDPELFQESPTPNRIRLAYVGDFYGLRSPLPLLQALENLSQRDPSLTGNLQICLIGNVEMKFRMAIDRFKRNFAGELNVVGQVPYLESLKWMKSSHLLLLIDAPGAINLFMPSKLIDYFGACKPILGITPLEGTTANLLRDHGHRVAEPDDVLSIERQMRELLQGLKEEQARVEKLDYSSFTSRAIASKLREIMWQMVGKE